MTSRTSALAGLAVLALLGTTAPAASAADAGPTTPPVVRVADGTAQSASPRIVASSVTASDQTVVFEATTVSVSVQVAASGATSTGTVTVSEGGATLGSAGVAGGTATVSLPRTLTVGSHTLTASYSGDSAVAPGTTTFRLTVVRADVAMSIDQQPTVGGPVQVFVTGPSVPDPQFPGTGSNGARPVGSVTLYEGTRQLGSAPVERLTSSMTASNYGKALVDVPARRLRAGTHELTAVYSGSTEFNGSQVTQSVTVTKASSTTTAVLPSKPRRGTPVRLRVEAATESGKAAAGRVVVEVDGQRVAVKLRRGAAVVKLGVLGRGRHVARVVYRGNDNIAGSRTTVRFTIR
jgi:hypothetical protein